MNNSKKLAVTPIGLVQDNFFSQFTGKKYSGLLITGTYFGSDSWDEYLKLYKQYEKEGALHPLTVILGQSINMEINKKSENDEKVIATHGPISFRVPSTLIPPGVPAQNDSTPSRKPPVPYRAPLISEPSVYEDKYTIITDNGDLFEFENYDEYLDVFTRMQRDGAISSRQLPQSKIGESDAVLATISAPVPRPQSFSEKRYKLVNGDSVIYYRNYDSYLRNWVIADPSTRGPQLTK